MVHVEKAVHLGVMAGGAEVKWCDGDTSKEGEMGAAERSKVWFSYW